MTSGSFKALLRAFLVSYLTISLNADSAMKCSYGVRGSLTVTCVNAVPNFFKSTSYRFRQSDETLRCINCNLTVIYANTFDLYENEIKEMDLKDSKIKALNEKAFIGLVYMQKLILANNRIEIIIPGTFDGTKKIITLDLSGNVIHTLTANAFAELIFLEELLLHLNYIKIINPGAFNGLAKLKTLDLNSNHFISNLNGSLGVLKSLESLNLHLNSLNSLSATEFFDLTNLKELDLSMNQLDEGLHITMDPSNSLRNLVLDNNNFKSIGMTLINLDALEELYLSHNQIVEAKGHLGNHLYNLRTLRLDNNKLTIIRTGEFIGFPQLRVLDLSNNSIADVEFTGVFSLQNVHSLDLSYNNISDIDYIMLTNRFPALTNLRLIGNVLPCALNHEMKEAFNEDNFLYVLDSKCVEKEPKTRKFSNIFQKEIADEEVTGAFSTGLLVFIFVLLWFVIIAVGVIYYILYLFYKGTLSPKKIESTVRLLSSEAEVVS